jgi:hypothetical protein
MRKTKERVSESQICINKFLFIIYTQECDENNTFKTRPIYLHVKPAKSKFDLYVARVSE